MVVHVYSLRTLSVLLHGQSRGNLRDEMARSPYHQNKTITKILESTEFPEHIISVPLLSRIMSCGKANIAQIQKFIKTVYSNIIINIIAIHQYICRHLQVCKSPVCSLEVF